MVRQVGSEIEDRLFRTVMGSFATGVTVITTEVAGEIHGMTANAFMSVSLNPKLVAISIGEKAKMYQYIRDARRFAINILSTDQQNESKHFSGQQKLNAEIPFSYLKEVPILENALAVIICELHSEYVVGDHTIFIGQVYGLEMEQRDPLLFNQGKYRELKALEG